MAPENLGAFIALLLATALPLCMCTAQNTYYVKPTPSTPCQEDPCNTLSQYVSETEQYLTSNTTVVFLPGEHVLQYNVTVSNVGRLAFIVNSGSSPTNVSRIICTDATLTFANISTLEITGLDFHSCTIELDTSSALFKNNSFENSTSKYGGAIYAHRSTVTFDGETRFDSNRAEVAGGGIFAEESNLTFHGNTTFINNEAIEQGGGLLVNYCNISFSGVSQFISNSAGYGGGVYVKAGSIVKFSDNSGLIANSAENDGGGVYIEGSTARFGDSSRFLNNSAEIEGGGVSVKAGSTVTFGDDSEFIDNSAEWGGGVCVWNSTASFGDSNRFIDNSAENDGGGVHVSWDSNARFGDSSRFLNNSAEGEGGGLSVKAGSTMNFGDDSRFIHNSAEWGGGVSVDGLSPVNFGDNSEFLNNSAEWGGGVSVWNSSASFGDSSRFLNNSAEVEGGGVSVRAGSTVTFGDDSEFIDNSAEWGGGVSVDELSTVSFGDASGFQNNSAEHSGGGVSVWNSSASFGDSSRFLNNSAEVEGGGVSVRAGSTVTFGVDSEFIDNSAEWGGGVSVDELSTVSFGDASRFQNNSAEHSGGGVGVWNSSASFGDNNRLTDNSAGDDGGGVHVSWDSTARFGDSSRFLNNSAEFEGGGLSVRAGSTMNFGDDSRFIHNSAEWGAGVSVEGLSTVSFGDDSGFLNNSAEWGGGVSVWISTLSFGGSDFTGNSADYFGGCMVAKVSTIINVGGSSHFMNNSASSGGCIYVDTCNLTFNQATVFSGNSAIMSNWYNGGSGFSDASHGGAILASKSKLTFHGLQALTKNSAGYGGAVYLTADSKIHLLPNTTMYFENNLAQYRGGALFVEDVPFTYCIIDSYVQTGVRDTCFFQTHAYEAGCTPFYKDHSTDLNQSIELQFHDNTANEAGSVLYGGNLVSCGVCTSKYWYVTGEVAFNMWANISSNLTSSDPYRVCICVDNHPDCNQTNTTREVFPGATIVVPVVAFGQYDGTVPAVIHTYISEDFTLGSLQSTQQSNNTCTDLQYTVRSTRDINIWSEATLALYADEPCSILGIPLEVSVNFLPCPLGFSLSTEGSCECDQRLNKYEVDCDINDQSILRKDNIWIGFDEQSDNQSRGLILHPHCPFDYCKRETDSVNFTMDNADLQCNYNRSGHLCGACQHGFSLAVGSSRCLQCSNKFLALLIPLIFAGLALVVFLFICKVTVAAGTISGLIFYANIVRVNQSIFFPSGETNILTVFIAWLNLDLGIESCFYDGTNAYSMMWLQFVFPIYIWLLVGLITILCNVSTTAANILGSTNPIAVLATLFLLTYTKLLRTTIAALSFTVLEYPDDETKVVWLYDGNIGYLERKDGRHIALFLASLMVFLFFFLPYTIFLLLGQCILPRLDVNKLRWLSWANYIRMKSILDAYHAPYMDRHHYWIGLLLALRFIMFLTSAIVDMESPQDPHLNLLVTIACTFLLAMWVWNTSGGVYRKWHINLLEASFIFNLGVLAAATLYVKLAGGNQAAVFYSSVSVAFSTFIGIVIYHVYQRLRDSRAWRNLVRKLNDKRARGHGCQREHAAADEEMEEKPPRVAPTVTYIDIPTDERRQMCPITPPLSPTNFTAVPESLDRLQREVAADEVVQEVFPQVAPTVTAAKAMCPLTPPPLPINFTELREPLDLLSQ